MNGADRKRAEQGIKESNYEFEQAMDHMEHKVADTTHQIQAAVDKIRKPKEMVQNFLIQTRNTASQLGHFAEQFFQLVMRKGQSILVRSRDTALQYKHHAQEVARTVAKRGQKAPRQIAAHVRENPIPYVLGTITTLSGVSLVVYLRRRKMMQLQKSGGPVQIQDEPNLNSKKVA